jgi:type III pantothenate kinase
MRVVATGGLAPLFDGVTPVIEKVDANLTLWGLVLIYRRNRKAGP